MSQQYLLANTLFYPALTLVNVIRFSIQGMGFSMFSIFSGLMEMIARIIAGMVLVPLMGFAGCTFASPLAWVMADIFLIPAYFHCKQALLTKAHHIQPAPSATLAASRSDQALSGHAGHLFHRPKKTCHSI